MVSSPDKPRRGEDPPPPTRGETRRARGLIGHLLFPARELLAGLDRCLERSGIRGLAAALVGLLLGWWIHVPVHELLHVLGCVLTGGSVDRLEIDSLYGGEILARWLPFVEAGGDYAGRLSGFDTGGSDLVYLATVLAPWILAVGPGPLWTIWAGSSRRALLWGASLPASLVPLMSLTGDALEAGGILVSRLPLWDTPELQIWLRSDDLFRTLGEAPPPGASPWIGLAAAQLLGAVLAVVAVGLGFAAARIVWRVLERPQLSSSSSP